MLRGTLAGRLRLLRLRPHRQRRRLRYRSCATLTIARPFEAFLEARLILVHCARHISQGQPAVGDLFREAHRCLIAVANEDRGIRVNVQYGFQRFADTECSFAFEW